MIGVGAKGTVRRGGELGVFSLERMRQVRCLTAARSCLVGEGRKAAVRPLLEVPRDRMTGHRHSWNKLELEKVPLAAM